MQELTSVSEQRAADTELRDTFDRYIVIISIYMSSEAVLGSLGAPSKKLLVGPPTLPMHTEKKKDFRTISRKFKNTEY